jgi:TRAP-type C4-dicarboxylate transport system substrate-binding protein
MDRTDAPVEFTRAAVALVRDWNDLPENERDAFAQAIAQSAAWWRKPGAQQAAEQFDAYQRFLTAAVDVSPATDDDDDWPAC